MKLPFFKAQKPEPKPTMSVFVPQRVPQPKPATSAAPSGPVPIVDNALTVPIHLKSILAQVPRGLLMTQDTAQLASITFAVPALLVTAQLSTGKVVLSLSQVADLLPQELVNKAVLANSGHHAILLPLSEVIAVIPPEALAVKPEREISLDTPELARLPGLFEPTAP